MVASMLPTGWQATASALNKRVSVFMPPALSDGYTAEIGEQEPVVQGRPAAIIASGGSESPLAGGREAGDRVIIVLRFERLLEAVDNAWTVRNDRTKRTYNILRAGDPELQDRWLYLLCEYGRKESNA